MCHKRKFVIVKNLNAKKNIVNVLMQEYHVMHNVNVMDVQMVKITFMNIDKLFFIILSSINLLSYSFQYYLIFLY